MTYKGAIFDFNGTLFWDTAYHNQAFDIFLKKHHLKLTDEEKRVKIHGKSNPDIMSGIFGKELTDTEIYDLSQEKELIYRNLCVNDLHFAPGAVDLFNYLSSAKIPFTIATSAGIENVDFYFEHMNLNKWFKLDEIVYNDGSFRGKPCPDIFLSAARKLQLSPHETVMFEDSVAGIEAAENAGAGKIYIVNSNNEIYVDFSYKIITHFDEVDRKLFRI